MTHFHAPLPESGVPPFGESLHLSTYEQAHAALTASGTVHTAQPPSTCLNGCHIGHGPDRTPVETEGDARICPRCVTHLARWLRTIPDAFRYLLWVKDHGTVPGDPDAAQVKALDAPAPLRLEILDLLDVRPGRGALGIVHGWAELVRDQRQLSLLCDCGHAAVLHRWSPPLVSMCRANCDCVTWRVWATVAGECAFIGQHLAWVTEQDWVADLYAELKPLSRQLSDAVGDYRPVPIGMCLAMVPAPGLVTNVICGGPLYRDDEGHGVHCTRCLDSTSVETLHRLGLQVGIFSHDGTEQLEAS